MKIEPWQKRMSVRASLHRGGSNHAQGARFGYSNERLCIACRDRVITLRKKAESCVLSMV
jgi:hypothetical protein